MNVIDIVITFIIIVAFIAALIVMARNKGKCSYCSHADSCPFRKTKC